MGNLKSEIGEAGIQYVGFGRRCASVPGQAVICKKERRQKEGRSKVGWKAADAMEANEAKQRTRTGLGSGLGQKRTSARISGRRRTNSPTAKSLEWGEKAARVRMREEREYDG